MKWRIWQRFRYLGIQPTTFLEGHTEAVQDIDVSSDGKIAASSSGYWQSGLGAVGSQDNTVRLWDLDTNKQLAVLAGHRAAILRVRFDSQAAGLVSASQDGAIKIWDVSSRTLRCELTVNQYDMNVATVDFSHDGKWIFAGQITGLNKEVGPPSWWNANNCSESSPPTLAKEEIILSWGHGRMWTVKASDAETIAQWRPAEAYSHVTSWYEVWAAALSPSGDLVAVAPGNDHGELSDYSVVLWNATSGKVVRRLAGHENHIRAVAFSADGQRLASGDESGIILIWDVSTGNEILKLEGHSGAIRSVKFGPGDSLLSGSTDHTLRRWLLPREPKESAILGRPWVSSVTRDGKYRFQTDAERLRTRDSSSENVMRGLQVRVDSIAVHSLSPLIVTEEDRQVTVRDADTLEVVQRLKGPFAPFESLGIGGNPTIVATSDPQSDSSMIRVWDVATGYLINRIDRRGHGKIAMTPDARMITAGCASGKICFWDPYTGHVQRVYQIEEQSTDKKQDMDRETIDVSITLDGQTMFFATTSGTLVAWDVASRQPLASRYFGPELSVTALNKMTAIVSVKSEIYVWDLLSNDVLRNWRASRVITHLTPGKDERTIVGLDDASGLLEWEIPITEIPIKAPSDKVALEQYYDLVGMQISDVTSTGRDVAPRANEHSEARLSVMLDGNDKNAQLLALSWLARGRREYPSLIYKVARRLGSPDSRVREAVVRVLSRPGAFEPSTAASAIAPALTDNDVEVRVSALLSIGRFGADAAVAVPQLRQLLRTTDEYSERLGAHISPRDFACNALGNIGPAATSTVPDLIGVIENPVPAERRPAALCARALGEIGDSRPEVIRSLLIALDNPEVNMRHQAAIALGKLPISSAQVIQALDAAAKRDPDSVEIAVALEKVRGRVYVNPKLRFGNKQRSH